MRYRKYGKTGLNLSVIGLGGGRYNNGLSVEENAERVVYARSKGINHFDSAIGYKMCEDVLAHALRQVPEDSFYSTTKDMQVYYKSKDELKDKVKRSLDKMGLGHFDFFYIWNLKKFEEYEQCFLPGGMYETLLEMKEEGLIRHIMLSSHLTGEESARIVEDGKIEAIMLNLNIMNFPYTMEAAKKAKEKGIGVVAMSPLAGGLIPANEEKFAFLAKENGPTYEALRFITSLPYVDCCYLSTANKEEVDIACEIADIDQPMDDEAIAEMEKLVGSGLDGACTGCGYCEDSCPQKIPIPAYMQFYNFKHLFGKPDDEMAKRLDWARRWFMLANRKADAKDCIACGDCAKLCTQKIDIPTRMKYLGDIERGL